MENSYKVIHYYSEEDNAFLVFAPELPGCCADGKNLEEALNNLQIIISEWIDTAIALGRELPRPMSISYESSQTDIQAVAKYILAKTGSISTMTLEKLAYYCLVWSLVWFNQPIFKNKFQAWKRGPVCKELFEIHKGMRVISEEMIPSLHELSNDEKRIIDCVLAVYGDEDGEFLSELTHSEKPWIITRGDLPEDANCERIIDNNRIRESYIY